MAANQRNILIVGAGIAGLTLAALLQERGYSPVIIEKQSEQEFWKAGYMLGLLPLGGRVLNALGKRRDYLDSSCSMKEYNIYDGRGRLLNCYSLAKINDRFGPYRGISRIKLIGILRKAAADIPVYFNTTVKNIQQDKANVNIKFSSNEVKQFNLVVAADGLHSQIRSRILDKQQYAYQQTGWGGWVSWIDAVPEFQNSYHEFWGAGSFTGLYPVKNKIGAFLGGPITRLQKTGRKAFAEKVQENFIHPIDPLQKALQPFKELDELYFWNFHDCKSERWSKGRVVLLGDAATGFLPTAGIGASMAMDSAAALADELSRADPQHLELALQLFENRQRPKVEKAQKESRDLGKWAFIKLRVTAGARNKILKFYSMNRMLAGFENIMLGK